MGGVYCLLGLDWAVTGGGTIRFWGACGVGVADGWCVVWRRGSGSGEVAGVIGFVLGWILWRGACILILMQIVESGIVSVVAVAYFLVAAKEDSAGVLAAVDLGALWLRRIQQWIHWRWRRWQIC